MHSNFRLVNFLTAPNAKIDLFLGDIRPTILSLQFPCLNTGGLGMICNYVIQNDPRGIAVGYVSETLPTIIALGVAANYYEGRRVDIDLAKLLLEQSFTDVPKDDLTCAVEYQCLLVDLSMEEKINFVQAVLEGGISSFEIGKLAAKRREQYIIDLTSR